MRWIKRIGYVLIVLIGLTGLFASLGKYYYENEVKQYVKSALNDFLAAPVDVQKISFSLLSRFPNASLSFEEVLAWDAFPNKEGKDTLLYAKQIFLEFNLIDLARNKYNLQEISIISGDIRLKWNSKGENNYVIWKELDEEENKESTLQLNKINFSNCELRLDHKKNAFKSYYKVDELSLVGDLEDQVLNLESDGEISRFSYQSNDFSYESSSYLDIISHLLIDYNEEKVEISDGVIDWNGIQSKAEGSISYGSNQYSFVFSGKDQLLASVVSILPSDIMKDSKDYSFNSSLDFRVETGNTSGKWLSKINFETKDGSVTYLPSAISAEELQSSGTIIWYKDNASIQVNSFSGRFSEGSFNGDFSMKNIKHPSIIANIEGEFELSKLLHFFKNDDIKNAYGSITTKLHFEGSFYDIKNIQKREIEKAVTNGTIYFDNASFYLNRLDFELKDLSGTFKLDDNDAKISELRGNWLGSDFSLNGSIVNFMPFVLLDNQKLIIKAKGDIDRIDLEKLLVTSENEQKSESFEIPRFLYMSIDGEIGEITYKKFKASDVYGKFHLKDGVLLSNDFGFNNAGGEVRANLFLQSSKNGDLELHVQSELKEIAINELFYEFENMGQKVITDKNINGLIDADVMFKGTWNRNLELDLSKMHVLANVLVKDGELKDVKSLEQIGTYLKSNAIASTIIDTKGLSEKLKNIHFAELQNQIEIKNRVITIPEMQIFSDAIDINLSGRHDFDNNIDYAINFRLREITKKHKRNEFNNIEDDGLGKRIFLKMEGTTMNPEFSIDKTAKKLWKKENWEEEKESIAQIIDQEFGRSNTNEKKKGAPVKFEIEWDELSDTTLIENKVDSTKQKQKTLIFQSDDNDVLEDDDDDY